MCAQRNMVLAWEMKGTKPSFSPKAKEFNGLELPQGTILEVEVVHELQGEVRICCSVLMVIVYFTTVLFSY